MSSGAHMPTEAKGCVSLELQIQVAMGHLTSVLATGCKLSDHLPKKYLFQPSSISSTPQVHFKPANQTFSTPAANSFLVTLCWAWNEG